MRAAPVKVHLKASLYNKQLKKQIPKVCQDVLNSHAGAGCTNGKGTSRKYVCLHTFNLIDRHTRNTSRQLTTSPRNTSVAYVPAEYVS